jgi:hypothetical protein
MEADLQDVFGTVSMSSLGFPVFESFAGAPSTPVATPPNRGAGDRLDNNKTAHPLDGKLD